MDGIRFDRMAATLAGEHIASRRAMLGGQRR
jgi:hypothetical protein